MHVRGVGSEVAVALGERLGDEPVLGDGCGEPFAIVARHPAHPHEVGAHGAQGGGDVVVVDRGIDGRIEPRDERVVVVASGSGGEGCSGAGELVREGTEQCGVSAFCGQACGRLLQRAADLEQRADVARLDTR